MPEKTMGRPLTFFKKTLETMPRRQRVEYVDRKLRRIVQYAYRHSIAFKSMMDSVGRKPGDIRTIKDLQKLPITKKAHLVDLQKKNPPFGGFEDRKSTRLNSSH